MKMNVYAATMPVQMDGPHAPPEQVPVTILAENTKQAEELARDAGFTFVGQLNTDGEVMPK